MSLGAVPLCCPPAAILQLQLQLNITKVLSLPDNSQIISEFLSSIHIDSKTQLATEGNKLALLRQNMGNLACYHGIFILNSKQRPC